MIEPLANEMFNSVQLELKNQGSSNHLCRIPKDPNDLLELKREIRFGGFFSAVLTGTNIDRPSVGLMD